MTAPRGDDRRADQGHFERGRNTGVYRPKPTTVLGWGSPWSGDENDPIPRRYWVWVRLHWADMRLRHRLGLHAWRSFPLNDGQRCDWCGAIR